MVIKLFNSLSKSKEIFTPIDPDNVRIYVCGPTVYDRPHLGNARSTVVYDLLFRLLLKAFPKVTYVRNITDVDDKINLAATQRNISIQNLTKEITAYFHQDMADLKVLSPTVEPRATEHIAEMIAIISRLIENGNAYESAGNVLFDVGSYKDYGQLSNRVLEDMVAGARIEVASYKKNPLDFILWKPAAESDDVSSIFDSPWGLGRPGWHIECSAMSSKYLGNDFDIHGGGADLQFPHHENEIAQSICANKNSHYSKYWVHNGFLTVDGEKMSKSLQNFITVRDLLNKKIHGIVIRYLLLSSHYRKPFDFNDKALFDARKSINKFYSVIGNRGPEVPISSLQKSSSENKFLDNIIAALSDDLNTPLAFATLHELAGLFKVSAVQSEKAMLANNMLQCLDFLGLYDDSYFDPSDSELDLAIDENYILEQIELRKKAKSAKDWQLSDEIRKNLAEKGIKLEDRPDGEMVWSKN